MHEELQFCTFTVDGLYLGIAVRQVQEVIRSLEMTAVPLAPASVEGLINLRGQIVTAIDLRCRLGLSPRLPGQEPMHVVVRTDDGAVSFMVDEIDDVIEVTPDAFERVPETLNQEAGALVKGVYKLADRLLLVLDTTRAVNIEHAAAA
ncbi:MAG: chemotaxis protein CheW [Gemmatimonadota bacterium]